MATMGMGTVMSRFAPDFYQVQSTQTPSRPGGIGSPVVRGGGGGGSAGSMLGATGGRSPKSGPATVASIADLFDETGLPTRLPQNAEEAMLFQLQASRSARQLQQRQVNAALSTLQYGLGLTSRSSPFGLGGLMSPLLSQMAGVQERVQYAPSDFSYFVREGNGAGGGGISRIGSPTFSGSPGVQFTFPPEQQMGGGAAAQVPTFSQPSDPFGNILSTLDAWAGQPQLTPMDDTQPMLDTAENPDIGPGFLA